MSKQESKTGIFGLVSAVALGIGLIVVVACAVGLMLPTAPALSLAPSPDAGTILVTTPYDSYSPAPNDCSLREAITAINTGSSFGGCNNPGGTANIIQLEAKTYRLSRPDSGAWPPTNSDGALVPKTGMIIRGLGPHQTIISSTSSLNDEVLIAYQCGIALEKLTLRGGQDAGVRFVDTPPSPPTTLTGVVVEKARGPGIQFESAHPSQVSMAVLQATDTVLRHNGGMGWWGGGLFVEAGGQVVLDRVTIHGNRSFYGGGIYFDGSYTGRTSLQMTNVTIYSNTAVSQGGGLYLREAITVANRATNVTIARNRAGTSGGSIYNYQSALRLRNTIIAGGSAGGSPNNCDGSPTADLISQDFNLDTDNTCGLSQPNDRHDANAGLAPNLANNGGKTPTLALLPGSPAIDNGTDDKAPPIDQRGVQRPQPMGGSYDIGAFEITVPPDPNPDKTVDDDTPRPGQRITFTLVVANSGASPATNLTLSDTIPTSLTFVTGSDHVVPPPPPGTSGPPPLLLHNYTLAAGQSVTVTFAVTVDTSLADGTVITNTAAVTSTEILTPRVDSQVITVEAIQVTPSLTLTKDVDDDQPEPGQRITFTIVVDNEGTGPTTYATLSDTLPSDLTFVSDSVSLEPATAGVTGTPPILADGLGILAGESVTVTFAATVNTALTETTLITNTAVVTCVEVPTSLMATRVLTATVEEVEDEFWVYLPLALRDHP